MPKSLPKIPTNYDNWRKLILKRDNYTCRKCGDKYNTLCCHHIKQYIKYPKLRFKLSNGITLCEPCHKKEHYYKGKNSGPKTNDRHRNLEKKVV